VCRFRIPTSAKLSTSFFAALCEELIEQSFQSSSVRDDACTDTFESLLTFQLSLAQV
jgi:hypothetical protein